MAGSIDLLYSTASYSKVDYTPVQKVTKSGAGSRDGGMDDPPFVFATDLDTALLCTVLMPELPA